MWTIPEFFRDDGLKIFSVKYLGEGLILIVFSDQQVFTDYLYDFESQTITKFCDRRGNLWPHQTMNDFDRDTEDPQKTTISDVDAFFDELVVDKRRLRQSSGSDTQNDPKAPGKNAATQV